MNIAKQNDDEAVISSTAYSKMIGGKCTHTDCVMDSGCSFPLTTTAITKALGIEVTPLKQKLEMLDASNRIMEIIGTTRIFIENDVLGGRKCVEAAVIEGEKKETLISLKLLKRWDLIHDSLRIRQYQITVMIRRKINLIKLTALIITSTQKFMRKIDR